ncbi:uncharacterized protein [Cicer arietinum]|uniref:uncharacterized protein n=1 Tax=Cicer arietinum TaxID=3827 RepID=UPI003CC67F62
MPEIVAISSLHWVQQYHFMLDCIVQNVDGNFLQPPTRLTLVWLSGFRGYLGNSNNTHAELMVVWHDLRLTRRMNFSHLVCYSDSMATLNLISRPSNHLHNFAVELSLFKIC